MYLFVYFLVPGFLASLLYPLELNAHMHSISEHASLRLYIYFRRFRTNFFARHVILVTMFSYTIKISTTKRLITMFENFPSM